jgi:peptidoglycan/LPS O-acetylase OafA/YrhL
MSFKSENRVELLDGIRGWASFAVLLAHLIVAFAANDIPLFKFDSARLSNDIRDLNILDIFFGILLHFFANGHLAVMIFFVLSGYVLTCRQLDPKNRNLALATTTRYFRLMFPILFTSSLVYLLLKNNLMFNLEVATIDVGYSSWLGSFYKFDSSLINVIKFSLVDVFFGYNKDLSYNAVLWTMSVELFGSFLVFSYLAIFKTTNKVNWLFLFGIILILLAVAPIYSCFLLGYALAEFETTRYRLTQEQKYGGKHFEVFHLCLFSSVVVLSSLLRNSQLGTILLATLFVYCGLNSGYLRTFFSNRFAKFLGKISFPLYLVQIPIVCSLSSWMYLTLHSQALDKQFAGAINVAVSLFACFGLATLFLPIERISIAMARAIGKTLLN